MPSGLKRYYGAHDLHFITCSCYRRLPLLDTANRRDLLLKLLEEARQRTALLCSDTWSCPNTFIC